MSSSNNVSKGENPNVRTIEVLQHMANYYDNVRDQWRTIAYRKAITQLKKQDQKIVTAAQAAELPWIGARLADKIEEIARTNRLRRLESTKLEPNDDALRAFLKVYGVGYAQAQRWIDLGYRSLQDLERKAILTKNQKIGVDHFDDFNSRIPRSEMKRHESFVSRFISKLEPRLQITVVGTYRRGAADSGDIDFIVTKADASAQIISTIMLERVIPYLFKADYLKTVLAAPSTFGSSRDGGGSKWHGACALPKGQDSSAGATQNEADAAAQAVWRRIDFLFVPWAELGAALIYFTGNDIFNRSVRLLASKKGMRLNQRGLWKDVVRGPKRERITQGTLVEAQDEKKIFEILRVPWREPWERVC